MFGYKMFLDDERYPVWIYNVNEIMDEFKNDDDWIIVRNFDEAIKVFKKNGCPNYISFDHDLGYGKTGMDFAKWVVEQFIDDPCQIPEDFTYYVHSANPVGSRNIYSLLDNYFKT